jgi:hypothetical protein
VVEPSITGNRVSAVLSDHALASRPKPPKFCVEIYLLRQTFEYVLINTVAASTQQGTVSSNFFARQTPTPEMKPTVVRPVQLLHLSKCGAD